MTAKRQKTQLELAFWAVTAGEARSHRREGTEIGTAAPQPEIPAALGPLMEAVVERDNLRKVAWCTDQGRGRNNPNHVGVRRCGRNSGVPAPACG